MVFWSESHVLKSISAQHNPMRRTSTMAISTLAKARGFWRSERSTKSARPCRMMAKAAPVEALDGNAVDRVCLHQVHGGGDVDGLVHCVAHLLVFCFALHYKVRGRGTR